MNKNRGRLIEAKTYIDDVILTIIYDDGFYDFERSTYNYNKNYQIPLHSHEFYEITFNGHEREFIFEDKKFVAKENHLVIIPPKLVHVQRMEKLPPYKSCSYTLMMIIQKNKNNVPIPSSLYHALTHCLKDVYYEKVPQRVAEIMKVLDIKNSNCNQIKFSLLIHELITLIIESSKIQLSDDIYQNSLDTTESRIYKIDTVINENYLEKLSLEQISQKLNISTRQISRIIKKQYGCTFKEFLTQKKINRAKYLLINTRKTITDISTEVGYGSPKSFYSAFLSECGCSPSQYRKLHKRK